MVNAMSGLPMVNAIGGMSAEDRVKGYLQKTLQHMVDEFLAKVQAEEGSLPPKLIKAKVERFLQSLQLRTDSNPGDPNPNGPRLTVGPSRADNNKQVHRSMRAITFPEDMWSVAAREDVPTKVFFKDVLKMRVEAGKHAGLAQGPARKEGEMLPDATQTAIKDLLKLLGDLEDAHYALDSLAFQLHGFLEKVNDRYPCKDLIIFKSRVREAIYAYNAHHPHHVVLERSGLLEMAVLPTIVEDVKDFLAGPTFNAVVKRVDEAKQTLVP